MRTPSLLLFSFQLLGYLLISSEDCTEGTERGIHQSMESISPSSSLLSDGHEASNFDEFSMQQSLLFSDSLKDLKDLRSQLYSAAEYFELSYSNDDQKEIVVSSLKDYAVKALVNTVDHLGSVTSKVNGLLDEKVDAVCRTEFRVSCIEQRLRTCQEYIDREGLSQQSLVITAPKYHKRYILPVGAPMPESGKLASAKYQSNLYEDLRSLEFRTAVHSTVRDRPPSSRELRSVSPSPRGRSSSPSRKGRLSSPAPRLGKFLVKDNKRAASPLPRSNSFTGSGKFPVADKRAVSPLPSSNPFARSGSHSSKSSALNSSSTKQWYPSEPQKSSSMRLHADRNDEKEIDQNSGKSRSFLKALLTRRRSRKDETLYTYLDEY